MCRNETKLLTILSYLPSVFSLSELYHLLPQTATPVPPNHISTNPSEICGVTAFIDQKVVSVCPSKS